MIIIRILLRTGLIHSLKEGLRGTNELLMIYVIGSGPSGISCARALLNKGAHVTMLDAGIGLEDERRAVVEQARRRQVGDWGPGLTALYKSGMSSSAFGVKFKTAYGSRYPYKDLPLHPVVPRNFAAGPSYAKGGFSSTLLI